jgi:hypothetical protein
MARNGPFSAFSFSSPLFNLAEFISLSLSVCRLRRRRSHLEDSTASFAIGCGHRGGSGTDKTILGGLKNCLRD